MRLVAGVAGALLACAGCDALFGLDKVKPIDATIVDLPSSCTAPIVPGLQCHTLTLPLSSDTYLSAASPGTPLGASDAIKISGTEPALFKFDSSAIATDEQITDMTLTLDPDWAVNAKTCSTDGATCQLCLAPSIGSWNLHWTITDWDQATWNVAGATTAWVTPGAMAIPQDRSDVIASGPGPTMGGLMVMTIPRDNLLMRPPTCYRSATRLAVLVTLEGVAYFASREGNACTAPQGVPATMTVTVCR